METNRLERFLKRAGMGTIRKEVDAPLNGLPIPVPKQCRTCPWSSGSDLSTRYHQPMMDIERIHYTQVYPEGHACHTTLNTTGCVGHRQYLAKLAASEGAD